MSDWSKIEALAAELSREVRAHSHATMIWGGALTALVLLALILAS